MKSPRSPVPDQEMSPLPDTLNEPDSPAASTSSSWTRPDIPDELICPACLKTMITSVAVTCCDKCLCWLCAELRARSPSSPKLAMTM